MFQYGATCYPSASTVNQLTGAAQAGSVVLIGGQPHVLAISGFTDTSITYSYSPVSGGAVVSQTVANIPPPCALLTAADAVEVGTMIGVAWVAVYAIKFLANYFQSEIDGIKNDT